MTHGMTVDRHELHVYLWKRTDRKGQVRIVQQTLADDLGVTIYTMSRIIRELKEDGRLRKIGAAQFNVGRYVVADPIDFDINGRKKKGARRG